MPDTAVGLTVREAVAGAAQALAEAGCDSARLDAELLLANALGVGRSRLVLDADSQLSGVAAARYATLIGRRLRREPVAYILGQKEFRRITLSVDPRVLIPRPETELLVEAGLSLGEGARVVDVGTGSGAVALALKDERPDLDVWGTDVSVDALAVARDNAGRLGLNVRFVRADLFEGVDRPLDAVLANLPYVEDAATLEPEISSYEPAEALFAGRDGLAVIRRLVGTLPGVSMVALEVGAGQAGAVSQLLRDAGYHSIDLLCDLAGHDRVVVGRRE